MDWPMRWVMGLVKRSGQVTEYEAPGYAWILSLPRWLDIVKERIGEDHTLMKAIVREENGGYFIDAYDEIYPLVSWVEHRSEMGLIRADASWERWEEYLIQLSIPGESEMTKPAILVDVPARMLFLAPDTRVVGMRLEAGLLPGWGWRSLTHDELRERAYSDSGPELILHGTSNLATMASLRSAQRRAGVLSRQRSRASSSDNDRVKAFILRRGKGGKAHE